MAEWGVDSTIADALADKVQSGIFGIFSYFSQIDIDGSGYLELNEVESKFWMLANLYSAITNYVTISYFLSKS